MDGVFTWDYYSLINELTQGMEHTKQLRTYLSSVASTSEPIPELLLQKIISSYEQSLIILKWSGSTVQSLPAAGAIESMVSGDGSARNADKKRSFKDHQKIIHISKKRKSQFTQLVRVSTESGFEGSLDDGYRWRKYGQKEILGAKFPRERRQPSQPDNGGCLPYFVCAEAGFDSFEGPIDDGYSWRKYKQKDIPGAKFHYSLCDYYWASRSYYRCTYRNTQNCGATKEVQRSDDDPTVFDIIYAGCHTCNLDTSSALQATSPEKEASHHSLIVGAYPPSFVSPTTPESNYFSVSSCQMNGLGIVHNLDHSESYLSDIGIFRELRHSDSDCTDTFSANTSTTSSSIGGQFARLSGARPDFSIWTKRHPQTEAKTPNKDDKDE